MRPIGNVPICSGKEALNDFLSGGEDYVLNGIFASLRTRESSEIVKIKLLRLNPKSINLNLEEKQSEVIIETNVCDVLELANPIDGLVKAEVVFINAPIEQSHTVGAAGRMFAVVMPVYHWTLSKSPKINFDTVTREAKRISSVLKYIQKKGI